MIRGLCAFMLLAAAVHAEEFPPFLFDQGGMRIVSYSTNSFAVVFAVGKREEWRRTTTGWASGSQFYTRHRDGSYTHGEKRYAPQTFGWSAPGGRNIYTNQGSIRLGTNTYRRIHAGYERAR